MSADEPSSIRVVEPYTVLAAGYDVVMGHVDYEMWASYVRDLIDTYHAETERLLELGCGTGSLALALQAERSYDYLATDRSEAMLKVARRKAAERDLSITFRQADFTRIAVDRPFDTAILLYDGLNYLLDERDIARLFQQIRDVLEDGGLFIVDQTTPINSEENEAFFDDEGTIDGFNYVRRSCYDPETRRHTTRFDITVNGTIYREKHVQRAYTMSEIQPLIQEAGLTVVACFAGMTRHAATDAAARIHWVLRNK